MSAFMCCPSTIVSVARCIVLLGMDLDHRLIGDKTWFEVFGADKKESKEEVVDKVYRKLVNLNIKALRSRYRDYTDMVGDIDLYDNPPCYDPFVPTYITAIQVSCFLYQCSEDGAINTDEYKVVDECQNILCRYLVDMELQKRENELMPYWR